MSTENVTDECSSELKEPANSNWPIVTLRCTGNGRAVVHALVDVLVRRALIAHGVIPASNDEQDQRKTG
jgi:hypothetical protein